jgi:hypothetical protein
VAEAVAAAVSASGVAVTDGFAEAVEQAAATVMTDAAVSARSGVLLMIIVHYSLTKPGSESITVPAGG